MNKWEETSQEWQWAGDFDYVRSNMIKKIEVIW
jgi:hypothetical protein